MSMKLSHFYKQNDSDRKKLFKITWIDIKKYKEFDFFEGDKLSTLNELNIDFINTLSIYENFQGDLDLSKLTRLSSWTNFRVDKNTFNQDLLIFFKTQLSLIQGFLHLSCNKELPLGVCLGLVRFSLVSIVISEVSLKYYNSNILFALSTIPTLNEVTYSLTTYSSKLLITDLDSCISVQSIRKTVSFMGQVVPPNLSCNWDNLYFPKTANKKIKQTLLTEFEKTGRDIFKEWSSDVPGFEEATFSTCANLVGVL